MPELLDTPRRMYRDVKTWQNTIWYIHSIRKGSHSQTVYKYMIIYTEKTGYNRTRLIPSMNKRGPRLNKINISVVTLFFDSICPVCDRRHRVTVLFLPGQVILIFCDMIDTGVMHDLREYA